LADPTSAASPREEQWLTREGDVEPLGGVAGAELLGDDEEDL
jgi:hypothetical protein